MDQSEVSSRIRFAEGGEHLSGIPPHQEQYFNAPLITFLESLGADFLRRKVAVVKGRTLCGFDFPSFCKLMGSDIAEKGVEMYSDFQGSLVNLSPLYRKLITGFAGDETVALDVASDPFLTFQYMLEAQRLMNRTLDKYPPVKEFLETINPPLLHGGVYFPTEKNDVLTFHLVDLGGRTALALFGKGQDVKEIAKEPGWVTTTSPGYATKQALTSDENGDIPDFTIFGNPEAALLDTMVAVNLAVTELKTTSSSGNPSYLYAVDIPADIEIDQIAAMFQEKIPSRKTVENHKGVDLDLKLAANTARRMSPYFQQNSAFEPRPSHMKLGLNNVGDAIFWGIELDVLERQCANRGIPPDVTTELIATIAVTVIEEAADNINEVDFKECEFFRSRAQAVGTRNIERMDPGNPEPVSPEFIVSLQASMKMLRDPHLEEVLLKKLSPIARAHDLPQRDLVQLIEDIDLQAQVGLGTCEYDGLTTSVNEPPGGPIRPFTPGGSLLSFTSRAKTFMMETYRKRLRDLSELDQRDGLSDDQVLELHELEKLEAMSKERQSFLVMQRGVVEKVGLGKPAIRLPTSITLNTLASIESV